MRWHGRGSSSSRWLDISSRAQIAEAPVKSHVSSILMKLGLRDRAQAANFATRAGSCDPASSSPDEKDDRGR
jgi:hypothetical protein